MSEHSMAVGRDDPDLMLIRGMAAGDQQALDHLYARHGHAILGFLMARLGNQQQAEEVLQDVMLAAWNNADRFRAESKVRTWLLAIARNRALNTQRGKKLNVTPLNDAFELASEETGPFEKVARNASHSALRQALDQLPPPQREVLVLVFFHQLTGPEVAEVLDISIGTVKSRLHRAKDALRRVIAREGGL
jgi:RNA polymerase sigma-70 factor (ECF subfamily)